MDRWNIAKTPRQLWESLRTHPQPDELARFILGSKSPAGDMFRKALLDVVRPTAPMPENVARTLRSISRDANETWSHLLRSGSAHCTDPTQAWRLFAAWTHTMEGEKSFKLWFQTSYDRLTASLDCTGLDDDQTDLAWQERMNVKEGLDATQWIFQLGTLDDGRMLERQLATSTPEAHASAAWTGLFNQYDDKKLARLLEGADLMKDAHYKTFLPQLINALEQNLENVPADQIYELTKAISRLGRALDRYVQVQGTLPPAPLDHLCRLVIPKNKESEAVPHIKAFFRRETLLAQADGRGTSPRNKL